MVNVDWFINGYFVVLVFEEVFEKEWFLVDGWYEWYFCYFGNYYGVVF